MGGVYMTSALLSSSPGEVRVIHLALENWMARTSRAMTIGVMGQDHA